MSDAFGAGLLVAMATLLGGVVASVVLSSPVGGWGPTAVNHRGFRVVVSLGIVLVLAVVVTRLLVLLVIGVSGGTLGLRLVLQLGAVAIAFGGGLYDDAQPEPTRGIVRQLGMLLRGRVAPGVVKLGADLVAGTVAVAAVGGGPARYLLGIPLIAGCANLWNLLDVRPGRAIKLFLPVAVAVGALAWPGQAMLLTAVAVGGAVALLAADLGEQGMLGDAGAGVLGVVIGIGLYDSVGITGLAVALAVVVALHVLSETVTLSRLIRWFRPLRWYDDLGTVAPVEREATEEGANGADVAPGPGTTDDVVQDPWQ